MSPTQTPPLFEPERWRLLRELLDRLDAQNAVERQSTLSEIAEHDPELAAAARDLLSEAEVVAPLPELAIEQIFVDAADSIPERIGPFRPVRRIGAGGMGTVWLAERHDADFNHRVALKLLDGDAAQVAQLAARERRVLAALSHPNITAFVDAGLAQGRAWLAMEFVDGMPLLTYCSAHALTVRARVGLYDQVCAAVAYAHSQLVVHRDLKPSNVLVAGDGTVKLLDFGIARVLDASDARTPATRTFTPEYAAPEQLRGERTTTTTDVYALGLMLFELVSGRRLPTLQRNDPDSDWTTATLAREASRPDELSTDTTVVDASLMRGDLGRILVHALANDPARRYGTVAQLRADLKRWLEHRPLTIERPALRYVAARFVRRNRFAVAVTAVALLALLAATAFAFLQANKATRMAARADHARTFLAGLFTNANPYSPNRNGSSTVDLLHEAARRIDVEFADAPGMRIELRAPIIDALTQLEESKSARELAQASVSDARQVYGDRAPQTGVAMVNLALATEASGDIDTARREFQKSYALLRDADDRFVRQRITAMTGLAKMANRRDDYAAAQRWHDAVLRDREAIEGPSSADIAMDLMNLSADAGYQEHFAQSEALAERAHAMLALILPANHPRAIFVDNELGIAQIDMGHCADAVKTMTTAVSIARANLPPGAHVLYFALTNLGHAQACAGNDTAAIATLKEASAAASTAEGPEKGAIELLLGLVELHSRSRESLAVLNSARADLTAHTEIAAQQPKALWAQAAYGDALAMSGDHVHGAKLAQDARDAMKQGKYGQSVMLGKLDLLLADALDRNSQNAAARGAREEALAIFRRVFGDDHPDTRELAARLNTP